MPPGSKIIPNNPNSPPPDNPVTVKATAKQIAQHRPIKQMKSKIIIVPIALFLILSLTSCDDLAKIAAAAESKAKPELLSHAINPDTWIVNNEWDYGQRVVLNLKNNGQRGPVILKVVLSTSEGEWVRTQTVTMDTEETKELAYVFTEPTVNATNIEYRITTLP